jgi:hypothetical protein
MGLIQLEFVQAYQELTVHRYLYKEELKFQEENIYYKLEDLVQLMENV